MKPFEYVNDAVAAVGAVDPLFELDVLLVEVVLPKPSLIMVTDTPEEDSLDDHLPVKLLPVLPNEVDPVNPDPMLMVVAVVPRPMASPKLSKENVYVLVDPVLLLVVKPVYVGRISDC